MDDESWIRGPVIGRGATATVSLASSLSDPHRIFALKSSHIPSASALLRNEHAILSKIGPHPNLITSLGIHVSREGRCNLWTEYVPGGTLADRIRTNQLKHPKLIPFYSRQILMGLEFLHANGVVHCDIKSANVLVCDDGSLKIADLGFSKAEEMLPPTFSGTPAFMAPEVARGEAQGFAADIWALGCTIVEMSTGKSPWPEETNPVSALYRIGFSVDSPCIPASLSEQGRDFVAKCLMREPAERWTATQLLKHPFVSDFEFEPLVNARSSPTCVLDLPFWDHLDADDDDDDYYVTGEDNGGASSNSAFQRIDILNSDPPSTSSWTCDESWIRIRANCSHQQIQITSTRHINPIGSHFFSPPQKQVNGKVQSHYRELGSSTELNGDSPASSSCSVFVGYSDGLVVSAHDVVVDDDDDDDDCVVWNWNLTCNEKLLFNHNSSPALISEPDLMFK